MCKARGSNFMKGEKKLMPKAGNLMAEAYRHRGR